jgi:hypothetical protein
MSEQRYPLSWPEGWKRTPRSARKRASFGKSTSRYDVSVGRMMHTGWANLSVFDAVQRVLKELQALGVRESDAIISTNVPVRLDGLPRSDRAEPQDVGAAVYWEKHLPGVGPARKQCMAIDRYDRVADNLAAIAASLEAMRAIKRHGGAEILDRAFQGFAALPERAGGRGWREILGFERLTTPTESMVKDHFRVRAADAHPDKSTGNRDTFEDCVGARRSTAGALATMTRFRAGKSRKGGRIVGPVLSTGPARHPALHPRPDKYA